MSWRAPYADNYDPSIENPVYPNCADCGGIMPSKTWNLMVATPWVHKCSIKSDISKIQVLNWRKYS